MKKFSWLIIFLLVACTSANIDITKVTKGMTTEQVETTVGSPDSTMAMPMGIEWWFYGDKALVIVQDSKVVNVVEDRFKAAEEMKQVLDELKKL